MVFGFVFNLCNSFVLLLIPFNLWVFFCLWKATREFKKGRVEAKVAFIGLVGRVFPYSPGDLGSISVHVIPKTLKMVLDTSLLNTQQYKVRIESKLEQSRERSSALLYTSV